MSSAMFLKTTDWECSFGPMCKKKQLMVWTSKDRRYCRTQNIITSGTIMKAWCVTARKWLFDTYFSVMCFRFTTLVSIRTDALWHSKRWFTAKSLIALKLLVVYVNTGSSLRYFTAWITYALVPGTVLAAKEYKGIVFQINESWRLIME